MLSIKPRSVLETSDRHSEWRKNLGTKSRQSEWRENGERTPGTFEVLVGAVQEEGCLADVEAQ